MTFRNHELELANEFVRFTGSNVFLTGKAGTGKTTFLHNLRENTAKRLIITAPTGVAAINAGGVTLHSFFQLPFGPFIPGSENSEHNRQRQFRFSKEKKNIIKSLDLLVIDEISMVRADLLDAVDAVLRRQRRSSQPFGGVQLLMIGDLHQLAPVARGDELQLLREHYATLYFFSSKALALTSFITIELQHIYRQSDAAFIKLLNQVRDNRLDPEGRRELNRRYIPNFSPDENQGYITLTTHNHSAEAANCSRLLELPGKEHLFRAEINGDFPEHLYPTAATLALKEGAQVMFLRNDSSPDKLYFNGKIGRLSKISDKGLKVSCPGDPAEIAVGPVTWENIKYTVDEKSGEIKEKVIGEFSQYPLKPAWAITIHKSQGLTFDRAVIDAEAAFTHGQTYVALSRCKTLEGVVLSSPLAAGGIKTDTAVLAFDENAGNHQPSAKELQAAKINYQRHLLLDCFDFNLLSNRLHYLIRILLGNEQVVKIFGLKDILQLRQQSNEDIFKVGENFKRQLKRLFSDKLPESDPVILERISKASKWFQEKFSFIFTELSRDMRVETDNVELDRKIKQALKNLKQEIAIKLAGIKCCEEGFSPADYLRALSAAERDFKPDNKKSPDSPVYRESDISHPELFQGLKEWRAAKAREQEVAHFHILHQKVIIQLAIYLPDTISDLEKIKGVGKVTAEKYGQELVAMVREYREKHKITQVVLPKSAEIKAKDKTPPSTNTKQTSLEMFNRGLTVSEIAGERGLANSTIEGHLAFFVGKGELDISRLLSLEKQKAIAEKFNEIGEDLLAEIKNSLGDRYSYGEIKIMLAYRRFLARQSADA